MIAAWQSEPSPDYSVNSGREKELGSVQIFSFLQPAFLTGCRREASETPSRQGARREGDRGVLDSTSRSPTKRNAVMADGFGAAADHW